MLRLLIVLIFFLPVVARAQAELPAPKLILYIVVDELNHEQLQHIQSKLSREGINRLSGQGMRFMAAYSSDLSAYPGTRLTSFYTGTTPSVHGLIGEQWFDKKLNKYVEAATNQPEGLQLTLYYNQARSISDYLKSFYGPGAKSAAIGMNSSWLWHTLGYSPDHLYQFNIENGTFYDMVNTQEPEWLRRFNHNLLRSDLLGRQWGPINDISSYSEFQYFSPGQDKEFRSFLYNMKSGEGKAFERLSRSPYANTLIRDLAVSLLASSDFGKDNAPDVLTLGFTASPFVSNGSILAVEKEDMLIRLDRDISSLINFIDSEIGRDNYLVIFTSAAESSLDHSSAGKKGLSTGVVEYNKVAALLNLYIMATHGQGKWVLGMHDNSVYLNHQLIKEKGFSLKEMQEHAATFLLEVSGIERAIPTHDLIFQPETETLLAKNLYPTRSGDILLSLQSGWQSAVSKAGTRQTANSGNVPLPLIIRGWQVVPGAWLEPLEHHYITPLILKHMGIVHTSILKAPRVSLFKTITTEKQ